MVRSATFIWRMVALRKPMASPVSAIMAKTGADSGLLRPMPIASTAAIHSKAVSIAAAVSSQRRSGRPTCARPVRPPISAPTRKLSRAATNSGQAKPGVPAAAKPRKTMLPVMLAVNTLPRPSTLAASTSPVVTDSTSNRGTRGSKRGVSVMVMLLKTGNSPPAPTGPWCGRGRSGGGSRPARRPRARWRVRVRASPATPARPRPVCR